MKLKTIMEFRASDANWPDKKPYIGRKAMSIQPSTMGPSDSSPFQYMDPNETNVTGIHNPDQNTTIEVVPIDQTHNQDKWGIVVRHASGREQYGGVLTVYHAEGLWQGYDWKGNDLDDEEMQTILDLFEDKYSFE